MSASKNFRAQKNFLSRETWGIGVFDDGKDSRTKKLGIMRDKFQCLAGSKKDPQKAQSRRCMCFKSAIILYTHDKIYSNYDEYAVDMSPKLGFLFLRPTSRDRVPRGIWEFESFFQWYFLNFLFFAAGRLFFCELIFKVRHWNKGTICWGEICMQSFYGQGRT